MQPSDTGDTCVSGHRHVFLPLNKLDKCAVCQGTSKKLRFCSACGERTYCSEGCQKQDWPKHKLQCGKTDRIELESFYPFLAFLSKLSHLSPHKPAHFALQHRIVNDVNPYTFPITMPDGWEAKLVMVDDRSPCDIYKAGDANIMQWFEKAYSEAGAIKFCQRIIHEGYVLPILTSIALAVLAEMYTTTSGAQSKQRRVRLKYRSSPIADFGIAKGSAVVTGEDKLAYYRMSDGSITHGQDPDDHYWLYFTTIRGEDLILDLSMFTFNMCSMVHLKGYVDIPEIQHIIAVVPAYFQERVVRINTPPLHKERMRISVLRNNALHDAIVHTHHRTIYPEDEAPIISFMEKLAGRKVTAAEKKLAFALTADHCEALGETLKERRWTKYPAAPLLAIDSDPGEMDPEAIARFNMKEPKVKKKKSKTNTVSV